MRCRDSGLSTLPTREALPAGASWRHGTSNQGKHFSQSHSPRWEGLIGSSC